MVHFQILTLFPELIEGYLSAGLMTRAREEGVVSVETTQLRDYAINTHGQVDDSPYGGGSGMVLRIEPAVAAIEAAKERNPQARVLHFTPRGRPLTQALLRELAQPATGNDAQFIILCSRYEGIDERIATHWIDEEVSVGDYVLMGGELAALVFVEGLTRLLPGVLGNPDSAADESFSANLLEYSQYTKPVEYRGLPVPPVLTSGNHQEIARWRRADAIVETKKRRPDLILREFGNPAAEISCALIHYPVLDKQGDIITSSITTIDLHDIARSARTYGISKFYVVHPVRTLRRLSDRICEHWDSGFGATYNPNRKDALGVLSIVPDFEDVLLDIEGRCGKLPRVVSTSARPRADQLSFPELRAEIVTVATPHLILFGTGWGLAPEILGRADLHLEPIDGPAQYNHLSVRAAAAIIFDRLLSPLSARPVTA